MNIVSLVLIFLLASVAILVFLWEKKDSNFFPCKEQPGIISVTCETALQDSTALELPHYRLAAVGGQKSLKSCTQINPRPQAQELTSGISSVMMSTW